MKNFYFYDKRYKTVKEKIKLFLFFLDSIIKNMLYFLSKKFTYFDSLHILHKPHQIWIKGNFLYVDDFKFDENDWNDGSRYDLKNEENKIGELEVNKVIFHEILNIDKLIRSRKKILRKYFNNADYFNNLDGYSSLNIKLDKILNNYSGNSSGNLLYFDFSKKVNSDNNLINSIFVKYNKIGESFLVLSYEVKVSSLFGLIQRKIFESENTTLWEVTRFKFKLRKNSVSHSDGGRSLGSLSKVSLENLISDLSHQIANTFKFIDGHFLKNKSFPCLVLFEKQGEKFNLFDFYNGNNFFYQGDIVMFPNDFKYNSSSIVYYFQSLKFSIGVNSSDEIKKMERKSIVNSIGVLYSIDVFLDQSIGDLIKKRGDLNKFLLNQSLWIYRLFPVYFKFLKLKLYSSQIKLFYERVVNDIIPDKIFKFHFSDSINYFKSDPNNFINKYENLEKNFLAHFNYKTKFFKKNVRLFNLVLKDFESLNNYKTNYFLQVIVILLTILTIYFSITGGFTN